MTYYISQKLFSSIVVGLIFLVHVNFAIDSFQFKISENLKSKLTKSSTIDIIVSFKTGTANTLQNIPTYDSNLVSSDPSYRKNHIQSVVSALQNNSRKTQKNVLEYLSKAKNSAPLVTQSFWISNQLFIKSANEDLIFQLVQFEEVESIGLDEIIHLHPVIETELKEPYTDNALALAWGIESIKAHQAWELSGGNAGEGIVVAIIDTGVRVTHEALRNNFLGRYGWYDPVGRTSTPYDNQGHGTHVTGTIVGRLGIGVAPNSTWMACKGCSDTSCAYGTLTSCAEFVTCPHLTDSPGSSEDCSKAPHIVSNSWGGGQGSNFYDRVIEAWHTAGIIPVFSIGNDGDNGCGSAGSPGDGSRVIGVGSTTSDNAWSSFSSLGPSSYGTIKPDISAPGSNIRSASNTLDTGYVVKQGTSMACPHVSGLIALMKSAVPHLSFNLTKTYLFENSDKILDFTGKNCGGMNDSTFPNNIFGNGKINALNTMVKLLIDKPNIPTTTTTTTTTTTSTTTEKNGSSIVFNSEKSFLGIIFLFVLIFYNII